MSHSADRDERSSTGVWIATIVAVVLMYIISPAPVKWMRDNNILPESRALEMIIGWVFYPLVKAYEGVPVVKQFYDWLGEMTE